MAGVFPSVLKTAKVVPVFKNDSKLATIVQSPSYQTLKKNLENLFVRDCISFSITKMLSITYSFDSVDNILNFLP